MLRFGNYFALMAVLCYHAQLIDGEEIPTQHLRTVVRHSDVTLTCRHPSSKPSDREVRWYFSFIDGSSFQTIADDSRFKLRPESHSLLIRNVTIEDAGMFICCFDGPCMDTFLVVLEFENTLSFASDVDDAAGEIIVSSKGDFSITAHHDSVVKVEIIKEPNIPICGHFTGNVVCYKRHWTNTTSYYINNANLHNSGRFVIQSSFMKLNGSYPLSILIEGKPVINMETVQSEDEINFICLGQAYPPPVFDFRFIPTNMENTDSVPSLLLTNFVTSNHSSNVSATVTIKQGIAIPGIVKCRASNSEGESYAVASLLCETFSNHNRVLNILKNNTHLEPLQFIIISPIESINDSNKVDFECKASIHEFSNWFHVQSSNLFLSGTLQDDFWVAKFTLKLYGAERSSCTAQYKNGTYLRRNINLPLELIINGARAAAFWNDLSYYITCFWILLVCLMVVIVVVWRLFQLGKTYIKRSFGFSQETERKQTSEFTSLEMHICRVDTGSIPESDADEKGLKLLQNDG